MTFILPKDRAYIIAEAGVNHDGDPKKARQLIDIAAEAKADAVKFQIFDPDQVVTDQAPLADYQKKTGAKSQKAMIRTFYLPPEEFAALKTYAEGKGIDFIVTPFDHDSALYLNKIGVDAMKTPSGEITNLPYMELIASFKLFTIISTGMSTMEEVEEAIVPFKKHHTPYALLHCVSSYPAPIDQINLRVMDTMAKNFGVPIGYSDHTQGIAVAVTSAKLGARIIEKHFTVNAADPGPDHAASLEPDELREMIRIIRDPDALRAAPLVEEALGSADKRCQPCEMNTRDVARRSIAVRMPIKKGEVITAEKLIMLRPGTGMSPKMLKTVIGKAAARDLDAGELLREDVLA